MPDSRQRDYFRNGLSWVSRCLRHPHHVCAKRNRWPLLQLIGHVRSGLIVRLRSTCATSALPPMAEIYSRSAFTRTRPNALNDDGAPVLRRRIPAPAGEYSATIRVIATQLFRSSCRLGRFRSSRTYLPSQIGPHILSSPARARPWSSLAQGRRLRRWGPTTSGCPVAVLATVGIATLSARTGLLQNSNSIVLKGKPLDRDISAALGQPIRLENDANCFAISEAVDGAAAGCRVVFGVILGTGVGGGIVIDRHILTGLNRIAGEWGHNPLPWAMERERPGHQCYCGKFGCIETFLSGHGLSQEYFSRSQGFSADQIAAAEQSDEPHAVRSLATYKFRLARSLAALINVVDPDIVVLGGGISNIETLYPGLADVISEYAFSHGIKTKVIRAVHGDF